MRVRSLLAILVCAVAVTPTVWAGSAPKTISDMNSFADFATHYYQHPQPELVTPAIRFMQKEGIPKNDHQLGPTASFFAEVFASNPKMVPAWMREAKKTTGRTSQALELAFRYADDPSQMTSFDPYKAKPAQNDVCWGAFYASGKAIYIDALVKRLAYLSERKSANLYATAATAQWSLSSNAREYPRVKRLLERAKAKAAPDVAKAIDVALTETPEEIQKAIVKVVKDQRAAGVW